MGAEQLSFLRGFHRKKEKEEVGSQEREEK